MELKKFPTEVTRKPMPSASDDEAFLRLGVPDGLETDGSQSCCAYDKSAKNGLPVPHNNKHGRGEGKVRKVLHEFKEGELRSGSKRGPVVKSRKQAIAIAMSEAGMSRKKRK